MSSTRHRIGLVLFTVPILFGWLHPYLMAHVPGLASNRILFAVMGDVMFIASFLVLGGDFWDKLRALFVHQAKAVFPWQ